VAVVNPQLQARAGRNIGVEPPLYSGFVQDAGAPETDVNPNADTVILECPQGMARSPMTVSLGIPPSAGVIVNRSAMNYNYFVIFVDDLGNELMLFSIDGVASNDVEPFQYFGGFNGIEPWVLCPGEKIILRKNLGPF
jgi:hypothetical protein